MTSLDRLADMWADLDPVDDWRPHIRDAIEEITRLRAALAAPQVAPVAWHCPNDPDSATAFFWRRTSNGVCPNCGKKLVPVYLSAPGAPDAQPNDVAERPAAFGGSVRAPC